MDTRSEIREFLTSRRARITPDQAGLRTYGTGPRRVSGLRREEVALLAGVSVDYYTRLERGNLSGVSLDERSAGFYTEWGSVAADVVAVLRAEAGRNPYDRELSDLVGELSTRSEHFRTLWAAHNVRTHDSGVKKMFHPLVGQLELGYEAMELVADPGLTMWIYSAEPASRSQEALNLLASWAATPEQETTQADQIMGGPAE
jgi:hypothetical protein